MASVFPSSLDSFAQSTDEQTIILAEHLNNLRDAIEKIEVKLGADNSPTTTTLDWKCATLLVGGRKIWYYGDSAPTGWSASAVSDCLVAVKGGSRNYNVAGGTTGGSWTVTGLSYESTHTHTMTFTTDRYGTKWNEGTQNKDCAHRNHYHEATSNAPTSHTHTNDATWRPDAVIGIIIVKD